MCPSHYLSGTDLSRYAMLNMTKIELGLISDADMYLVFEKDMTSRVSYISKRYRQAYNKYLKSFDPKQKPKHIMYLDAINYTVVLCLNFFHMNYIIIIPWLYKK